MGIFESKRYENSWEKLFSERIERYVKVGHENSGIVDFCYSGGMPVSRKGKYQFSILYSTVIGKNYFGDFFIYTTWHS